MSTFDAVERKLRHFTDKTGALVEYDAHRDRFLLNLNGKRYALEDFDDGDWLVYYGEVRDDRFVQVRWSDSVFLWEEALLFTEAMAIWDAEEIDYELFQVIAESDRRGLIDDVELGKSGDTVHVFLKKRHRESTIVHYSQNRFVYGEHFHPTADSIHMPRYAATASGLVDHLQAFERRLEAAL